MKYLLTGGSGFLGGGVAERLVERGHQVVVLARSPIVDAPRGIVFYPADIRDEVALSACARAHPDVSGVIHLAALVPATPEQDRAVEMCRTNIEGTVKVLEAFGGQIDSFTYGSTAEVYGAAQTDGLIGEDLVPQPLSNYGASKLAGEQFALALGRRHSIRISVLRFSVMYGPGDRLSRAIPNFVKAALAGQDVVVRGGDELRDYLHVSDAIEATCLAVDNEAGGVFNIGTGTGISIRDMARCVVEAVTPPVGLTFGPPVGRPRDVVLDVARAERELGFTAQQRFPDRLDEQVRWHRGES